MKNHLNHVFAKLHVRSRTEAVVRWSAGTATHDRRGGAAIGSVVGGTVEPKGTTTVRSRLAFLLAVGLFLTACDPNQGPVA